MDFLIADFIKKKRDGQEHTAEELRQFAAGIAKEEIADYQVSAWLMAVFLRGLTRQELGDWTEAMWKTGSSIPKRAEQGFWVDKHSTGGVGDKSSLLLVPLVACVAERLFGEKAVRIPMVSGRGLGLTGGTLDKLESVPGFRCRLKMEEVVSLLENQAFCMAGQSADVAPVDRRTYALRDVTGTVESIPLIVSSILCKKLSESLNGLVMDVKVGGGATMKSVEDSQQLTQMLLNVGREKGLKMTAVVSSMEEPTGYAVGHALEVEECADFLTGKKQHPGLRELVVRLAVEMLLLAGEGKVETRVLEEEVELELSHPEVYRRFVQMFTSQGGNWAKFEKRDRSGYQTVACRAAENGFLDSVNAQALALLLRNLGGSRLKQDQKLDLEVGIRFLKHSGESVAAGEAFAEVILPASRDAAPVLKQVFEAVSWKNSPVTTRPTVLEVIR